MPLQDHFRPPLSTRRHWHGFHNAWATYISADLNRQLPDNYFAEPNVQFGFEIDVATFDEESQSGAPAHHEEFWTPPEPTQTIPITLTTDIVEVRIFSTVEGPELAGAIELVSPANKDRPDNRDAFVSKCASYIQNGIGLIIVDVVTNRRSNLHKDLAGRISSKKAHGVSYSLYAVAYRPITQNGTTMLEIWPEKLAVGKTLPTLPLWLPGAISLRVNLEQAYVRTCEEQRM